MKILIMPDGMDWIVDRNCRALVEHLKDIEFTMKPYTKISSDEFIDLANEHDLVHYFNWDIKRLKSALPKINKPLLMSVRSHRYDKIALEVARRPNTWIHVINPDLLKDFPKATYIPNGIFEQFKPARQFTVGSASYPKDDAQKYKGVHLIKEACDRLGVRFKPALGDIKPEDMPYYYKSIDVYVCASEAEGFSTAIMECLAMNISVVTVDTGLPRNFDIVKVPRTVEGMMSGIKRFYTQDLVKEYSWDNIAPKYRELYEKILDQK